ncbi:hypothetical protein RI129_004865 [Pyrocoelia pectoralis]|uniref:Uncharacterized protein n=1 Tax=Pyrocoelia pectoralis TaxID=417401 RepID=A0AAN7ZRK1_9COLE
MLDKLEREPFILNKERGGDVEEALIKKCIWITDTQTYIYYGLGSITLTAGFLFTIIKRISSSDFHDWEFAYGPITILNVTYSPNYEISVCYQNLSIIWIGYHFVTADLLVADILVHISVQFKMLQNNFRRIISISLAKQEVIFFIINFSNNIAFMLPLGDTQILRNLFEGMSIALQVLIICFWGQEVTNESELVADSILDSNFAGTDLRFQKALQLSILRSQKPTTLTAGKFTTIGLPTFAWIMRTSYSAFMVVYNQNAETE